MHFEDTKSSLFKRKLRLKAVLLKGDKVHSVSISTYTVFEFAKALVDCPSIVDELQIIFPEHLN